MSFARVLGVIRQVCSTLISRCFGSTTSGSESRANIDNMAAERTRNMRLQTQGSDDLASRILRAMEQGRYSIAFGQDVVNIVYVEGMDPTGKANAHLPNTFDSIRVLVRVFESGPPRIIGIWEATTEPGRYWTEHPMNPRGAARIAFGQYPSWIVGQYHDQEALIQVKPITVYRDYFRHYKREGPIEMGVFGIHQHWGYDYPHDDLGRSSAGCLVGRTTRGHREFMQLVKTDKRFREDSGFLFPTLVIPSSAVPQS